MPQMRINSLKSLATNCGQLSEMIRGRLPGICSRVRWTIVSTSDSFLHRLADLRVADEQAIVLQDAAKEVERPADIDMGHIDVPVLMRPHRLLEALPLLGRLSPQWRASFPAALSTR